MLKMVALRYKWRKKNQGVMMFKTLRAAFAALLCFAAFSSAVAQGSITVYEEQGELKRGSRSLATHGSDVAGDVVDMYTGALTFKRIDVDLPGNDNLRVAWGRSIDLNRTVQVWNPEIPRLQGIYAAGMPSREWVGWVVNSGDPRNLAKNNRCSNFQPPPEFFPWRGTTSVLPHEFWNGHRMVVPGKVNELLLSRNTSVQPAAGSWPVVTKSYWQLSCIPLVLGDGEGFLAMSPDGTQYRFDRMVSRPYFEITGTAGSVARQEIWILPSRVTDRFGNYVEYSYDAANPWRVTQIAATDGRKLVMTYAADGSYTVRATTTDGTPEQTWTYSANGMQVIEPDGSQWNYDLPVRQGNGYAVRPHCEPNGIWNEGSTGSWSSYGTVSTPSGATVSFELAWTWQGVANVVPPGYPGSGSGIPCNVYDPGYQGPMLNFPILAIKSKTIAGPGLAPSTWNYDYGPSNGSWICRPEQGCPTTKTVTVTHPQGYQTRHTFSNIQYEDGELLRLDEGWNAATGTALRTTLNTWVSPQPPPGFGIPDEGNRLGQEIRVLQSRTIQQQGAMFSYSANFDSLSRPTTVTRSGPGASRTETTAYLDSTSPWAINLEASVTEATTGAVSRATSYVGGSPYQTFAFGQIKETYNFNADGTLNWVRDGRNLQTTYSNYKRGLARTISYADGTAMGAAVDDLGRITSLTNEAGTTTTYGYDMGGRLSIIGYPAGDPTPYNATTLTTGPVAGPEYDLAAGHWRQEIATGNARKVTYFDGLWRPVLTREYDAADEANTRSMVLRVFDGDGRTRFASYPQRSITGVNAQPYGQAISYDALGRVLQTLQDSEQGWLTTDYAYQPGLQTAVTNPRGYVTTTTHGAFDDPDSAVAMAIAAPEGVNVNIGRDIWAKPTQITRSGGGKSATRSYVYDTYQRLCKTIQPESGATIQAYDAANNISWRASGQALPSASSCDDASVPNAAKVIYAYDSRNRLIQTSYADNSPWISRSYTPDGLLSQIVTRHVGNPITWNYTYNNRRLLVREQYAWWNGSIGASDGWNFSYGFDANGNVSSLTDPWGPLNYAPNALGQPTQVSGFASGVSYHPNGVIAGYTLDNGITHTAALNVRGLPQRITDAGIAQDAYSYDANGNVTAIADEQEGINNRSMPNYDGLDRLRQANGPWGTGQFNYDALDNLTASTVGGRSLDHNIDAATNRLTSLTGSQNIGIGYDANGNVTQRGGQSFVFDIGNRMVNAPGKVNYNLYDGHGRRNLVWFADGNWMHQAYSRDGKLRFAYRNTEGHTRHVYLADKLIAETTENLGTAYSQSTTYAHTDALGSPIARTNSSGGLVSRTRYEPYGATVAGSTNPTKIGFTGHVNDADTGLVYMQQRYYDPVAGRFLSVDPVTTDAATGDSFNRYVYGNNNPYKYKDPDGKASVAAVGAGVLLVGAAVCDSCRQAIGRGIAAVVSAVGRMFNQSDSGSGQQGGDKAPPVPDKLVGTVDDKSGQQGNRFNNGPLAPENGGTGDAAKDFGNLTGGKIGESGKYPGVRGENGIGMRPGKEGEGPRIDIPANGNKPAETLHYPKPEPKPEPK